MRSVGWVAAVFLPALVACSCSGGSSVDTSDWKRYDGPSGCVSVSYPTEWDLHPKGDLGTSGLNSCPGSAAKSESVPCNEATMNAVPVLTVGTRHEGNQTADASVDLYLADQTCQPLAGYLERLLSSIGEFPDVSSVGDAIERSIGGYPAKCVGFENLLGTKSFDQTICVVDIDGSVIHLFASVNKSTPEESQIVEAVISKLVFKPVSLGNQI